jgi:hypothetical protein
MTILTAQGVENLRMHIGANLVWKESLDNLSEWVFSVQTDPDVQDVIAAYLNGQRNDSVPQ